MRRLPILLACALLLAACGKEQEPAPRLFEVKAPRGERRAEFPRAGMAFGRPANWTLRRRELPAVFELTSGQATVAGWAYLREEDLPETDGQLEAAKDRLVEAIEKRDPEFRLESARTTEIAGSPAIDVRGRQVIAKRRLGTRSVHVFESGVEYVIEALAPAADHEMVDRRVLQPLLRSLTIEGVADEDGE